MYCVFSTETTVSLHCSKVFFTDKEEEGLVSSDSWIVVLGMAGMSLHWLSFEGKPSKGQPTRVSLTHL